MGAIDSRDEPLRIRRLGSRLRLMTLPAARTSCSAHDRADKAGPMQVESSEPRSAGRTPWHCSSVAEGCAASSGCLAASQDARCRATATVDRRWSPHIDAPRDGEENRRDWPKVEKQGRRQWYVAADVGLLWRPDLALPQAS